MPVNQKGNPDRNTQPFVPQENPHVNPANDFTNSVADRDGAQKKQDVTVLKKHEASMREVERQHQKGFRKSR